MAAAPETQSVMRVLRERLAGIYGNRMTRLVLYGSRARGETREDSDFDVLIVLAACSDAGLESDRIDDAVSDLCLERDVLISCNVVSEDEYLHSGSPLIANIRREGLAA